MSTTIITVKLEPADFKKFRVSESVQFFTDANTICRTYSVTNLAKQIADFKKTSKELDIAYKQKLKSDFTAVLSELDSRRDNALTCLAKIANGYVNHYKPNKQEASVQITNCVKKYGSRIYDKNYQAETAILANLGDDLFSTMTSQLNLLHLKDVAQEMVDANTLFNQVYLERISETAKNEMDSAGEFIKDALIAYRTLTNHITAYNTISPSNELTEFIKKLNALITKYNNTMDIRYGTANNDDMV